MQIKTTMKYHYISPEWVKWIVKTKRWQACGMVKQLEVPYSAGRIKSVKYTKNFLVICTKDTHTHNISISIGLYLYLWIFYSILCRSAKEMSECIHPKTVLECSWEIGLWGQFCFLCKSFSCKTGPAFKF